MAAAGAAHPGTGEASGARRDQGLGRQKNEVHPVSRTSPQLEELKQQLEQQEEELGRLRLGVVRLRGGWGEDLAGLGMEGGASGEYRGFLSTRGRQTQRKGFSISPWRTRP